MHLTWQDPVALALVVCVLLFTRWFRRRVKPVGCHACPHVEGKPEPSAPTPPVRIAAEQMRLARPRR